MQNLSSAERNNAAAPGKRRRKLIIGTCLVVILLIAAAAFWLFSNYIFVCGGFHHKGEDIDLRGKNITVEQYQVAASAYPQLHIYWDIPIGGERYDCTSESIAVGDFSVDEVPNFAFFDELRSVDGSASASYDALAALRQAMPDCRVNWIVRIGADEFPDDATDIVIDVSTSFAQLQDMFPFLPRLQRVDLRSAELKPENAAELLEKTFPDVEFLYYVTVCGQTLSNDVTEISLPGADAVELAELSSVGGHFLHVETIDLGDTLYAAEDIIALRQAFGGAKVLCRLNFYGVETASDAEELDLSGIQISDTSGVDKAVASMSELKKIVMSDCGISDEDMDALNKKFDDVRIVWTVYIKGYACRTDAVDFCISRITSSYGRITNEMVAPLQYCTDMVTLDLGHMEFDDISSTTPAESSEAIRERVIRAREIQTRRYADVPGVYCNAQMNTRLMHLYAQPDAQGLKRLKEAMTMLNMSARAYDRILRVARTIADLDGSERVEARHIIEAIGYRNLDRANWAERGM